MIIWLASYPKSGNTWVRIFLSSLLYSKNNEIDFNVLKNIRTFPKMRDFIGLCDDIQNRDELIKNWIPAQDILNLNTNTKIFKTHNLLCSIKGNSFTNLDNTLGVIHVVRDPRNVITSVMNHFSYNSLSDTKKFIFDEYNWLGLTNEKSNKKEVPIFIGSWKTHYLSWKNFPKNYLMIKYEDILINPEKEFLKIVDYLKKFINFQITSDKLKKIIKNISFDELKKREEENLFTENVYDLETEKKIKFFNLGPKNEWKKLLDKKILSEIELEFKQEMSELGYL